MSLMCYNLPTYEPPTYRHYLVLNALNHSPSRLCSQLISYTNIQQRGTYINHNYNNLLLIKNEIWASFQQITDCFCTSNSVSHTTNVMLTPINGNFTLFHEAFSILTMSCIRRHWNPLPLWLVVLLILNPLHKIVK